MTATYPQRVFLSAQWRALAMLNWEVSPELLLPLVPRGTELDFHQGKTYISLVGFLFLDTYLLGLPIPWHRSFAEVNLRFYIRRIVDGEVRRAVAFVKEIVPRPAIALVARWAYNEPYVSLPMRHKLVNYPLKAEAAGKSLSPADASPVVGYDWGTAAQQWGLEVQATGERLPLVADSKEAFITEHYWGYCAQRDGGTVEYRVEHPAWDVWQVASSRLLPQTAAFYGDPFTAILSQPPTSALLADGSPVKVYQPLRIA